MKRLVSELSERLIYEDADIVVFDKPAGLLVAPDRDPARPNLMAMAQAEYGRDCLNAHRLDRETSGLLVCARHRVALRHLCRQFERREVSKEYAALVRGAPPADNGEINAPLSPDPRAPGRMRVNRQAGRPAVTEFEVLTRWRGFAFLRLRPLTGRTHQLRVHLASQNLPIVGERFYADDEGFRLSEVKRAYKPKDQTERPLMDRLALHAWRIEFQHPVRTDERLRLEAPLPKPFDVTIRYLKRFAGL